MSMLQTSKDDMQRESYLKYVAFKDFIIHLTWLELKAREDLSYHTSVQPINFFQIMQFKSAKKDTHSRIKNDQKIFKHQTMQP